MTNDPLYNQLRELSWRRKLTGDEEAALRSWLTAHPEAQEEWEVEAVLNEGLSRLPDAPVASNFTARVLQAVELDQAAEARRPRRKWQIWIRLGWLPRVAVAAIVLGAGLLSFHQVQLTHNRARIEAVAAVADVSSLPSPDVLKDFDAIQRLSQAPPADEELLAALQ
jgi:anti-sigma factor RsiW